MEIINIRHLQYEWKKINIKKRHRQRKPVRWNRGKANNGVNDRRGTLCKESRRKFRKIESIWGGAGGEEREWDVGGGGKRKWGGGGRERGGGGRKWEREGRKK